MTADDENRSYLMANLRSMDTARPVRRAAGASVRHPPAGVVPTVPDSHRAELTPCRTRTVPNPHRAELAPCWIHGVSDPRRADSPVGKPPRRGTRAPDRPGSGCCPGGCVWG